MRRIGAEKTTERFIIPDLDTARLDALGHYTVEVRDAAGRLVFGRAPGALPLRWYIDEALSNEVLAAREKLS